MDIENLDDKFKCEKLNFKINENIDEDIIDIVSSFFAFLSDEDSGKM